MDSLARIFNSLTDEPQQFADCCCTVSTKLLRKLCARLPQSPSLVLSVGAGTGLLESLMLHFANGALNIHGVEVESCVNKYLPPERMLRVSSTHSLHSEALLADYFLFVYPRSAQLVADYLRIHRLSPARGALLILPRSDWAEVQVHINRFGSVHASEDRAGLADYEILVEIL